MKIIANNYLQRIRFRYVVCVAARHTQQHTETQNMKTQVLHVDHRKVEVEIRDAPKGRKLIIAKRDMGASEMLEANHTGAYIRKQWNKTYVYKRCAGWALIHESQMHLIEAILA